VPNPADPLATILLVEDDWQVRQLTERVLARHGYRVLAAASATEALELSDAMLAEVDLLVSDVGLPGLDGPSLVRILVRRRPGLRALLVSGYADPALIAEAVRDVPGGFLQKPYTPDVLIGRIRELCAAPTG
jgi:DNA-binding NtrC family response regulator